MEERGKCLSTELLSSPQRKEGSWSINTLVAFAGKLEGEHLRGAGREGGRVHEIQTPLWEVKF